MTRRRVRSMRALSMVLAASLLTGAISCIIAADPPNERRTEAFTWTEAVQDVETDSASKRRWTSKLGSFARNSLVDLERHADSAWAKISKRTGRNKPRFIASYAGYGNTEQIWVTGRVLANKPYGGPQDDDNWLDNLRATHGRWNSRELAHTPVTVTYRGESKQLQTDDEGYYHASFERRGVQVSDSVLVECSEGLEEPIEAHHTVYGAGADSRLLVISDMDDTVIHTNITDLVLAAQLTFLNNAKTRQPLLGVGALYSALQEGPSGSEDNPVVYVSNSAWNMYDLLRDFVDLNDIPPGPILLRDIGFTKKGESSKNHKIETIRELMIRFSELPAVLVGDSGQHDVDIYRNIVEEFPGRVLAVYIRDVDPDSSSPFDSKVDGIIQDATPLGVPFLRVANSSLIAEHAQKLGLLTPAQVQRVASETEQEEDLETLSEEVLEEIAPSSKD